MKGFKKCVRQKDKIRQRKEKKREEEKENALADERSVFLPGVTLSHGSKGCAGQAEQH